MNKEKKKVKYGRREIAYQDPNLPHCILVDIDGTLALCTKLNSSNLTYSLNKPVLDIINNYSKLGSKVFLVTGRNQEDIEDTKEWLKLNDVKYDRLYVRNDTTKSLSDKKFKLYHYKEEIQDKFYVDFCLEDRDKNVKMYRDLGLLCLQVYYGDF